MAALHWIELALAIWLIGVVLVLETVAGIFWWRFGVRYAVFFALIQLVSWTFRIPGWVVVPLLAIARAWHLGADRKYHWPWFAWIYDNEEDGVLPDWYRTEHSTWPLWLVALIWCGFRNSTNNLRYVPGVSKVGRPFYRLDFNLFGKPKYVQAGWNPSGYPVISWGAVAQ